MKEVITIGLLYKEDVVKQLEKFEKKCKKYNVCDCISYSFSDNYSQEYTILETNDGITKTRTVKLIVQDLTIEYETVRFFNDYEVIARVELVEGKNIVDLYNTDYSHYDFDDVSMECKHCNTNKKRKYIYILLNKNNLTITQVGKSCLQEYMNEQNVIEKVNMFDAFRKLMSKFNKKVEDTYSLNWSDICSSAAVDTDYFLSLLIEELEEHSFVKYPYEQSTAYTLIKRCGFPTKDKYKEKVQHIKSFYEETQFNNDFEKKIKYLLSKDIVRLSDFNALVYAISIYDKYINTMEKQDDIKIYNESEYQGEVGQLLYISCKLINEKQIEGYYGYTYLYTFADKDNNVYVWFSSNRKTFEEDYFKLKGRVKEHKTFNDVKQTQLTRCKLV